MIQTLFGSVEQEPTLLEKLKSGVEKTRAGLVTRLEDALAGKKEIDADLLDELEYTLISADIGVKTTSEILERIRQQVDRKLVGDACELRGLIRQYLLEVLEASERPVPHVAEPPAAGRGPECCFVRCAAGCQGAENRLRHYRYNRPAPDENQFDGGTRKDAAHRGTRRSVGPARGPAGARCHDRSERPRASAAF